MEKLIKNTPPLSFTHTQLSNITGLVVDALFVSVSLKVSSASLTKFATWTFLVSPLLTIGTTSVLAGFVTSVRAEIFCEAMLFSFLV